MPPRQPLPRIWLMTDERADASLDRALLKLPRGAGIVFRHYATPAAKRRARFEQVRDVARRRGLVLVLADTTARAGRWRADGVHGRDPRRIGSMLRTASIHSLRELRRVRHADMLFLSPVFATRSHPGAAPLGRMRFTAIARRSSVPVIALGGIDARRAETLAALGAYGWAAIDAWS